MSCRLLLFIVIFFFLNLSTAFADNIKNNIFYYSIKPHNNLSSLKNYFNITQEELLMYNSKKVLEKFYTDSIIKIPLKGRKIISYHIKPHDTLLAISRQYNTPLKALQFIIDPKIQKNMWVNSIIYIPVKDNIPVQKKEEYNLTHSKKTDKLTDTGTIPQKISKKKEKQSIYKIQKGDTFYSLSHRFKIPVEKLQTLYGKDMLLADTIIQVPKNPKNDDITSKSRNSPVNTHPSKNYPLPYKLAQNYSSLIPGVKYLIHNNDSKNILSPIEGVIAYTGLFYNFGESIIIQNTHYKVIIASKGFKYMNVKKNQAVTYGKKIASIQEGYTLYYFKIKDGKAVPPFLGM